MMNRHRKAAHRNRFYAGKDKPTILFRERFDMEAGDPAACLICFVREGKEDKVWFGLYEGAQILPLQGEYEQIAREMAGEAWESGVAASIPTPLRTVLSRDMYLRYRDEYVPGEAEADDDEEVYGGARRKQLKLIFCSARVCMQCIPDQITKHRRRSAWRASSARTRSACPRFRRPCVRRTAA